MVNPLCPLYFQDGGHGESFLLLWLSTSVTPQISIAQQYTFVFLLNRSAGQQKQLFCRLQSGFGFALPVLHSGTSSSPEPDLFMADVGALEAKTNYECPLKPLLEACWLTLHA